MEVTSLSPVEGARLRRWRGAALVSARALLLCLLVPGLALLLDALAPGDALADLRLDPAIGADAMDRLRAIWDVDVPVATRYGRWLQSALQGDLGQSFRYHAPVWTLLRPRIVNTLQLTLPATLLAWTLAVPLGVWSAAARSGRIDRAGAILTAGLLAVPELLLALTAVAVGLSTGWFPVGGMHHPEGGDAADLLRHLAAPCGVLALCLLPTVTRHVRSAMQDALRDPALTAARARGLPARRLLWRHALPLASAPLATLLGLSASAILSASLVVEVVFDWPGLGPLLLEATLARDAPVVAAVTTLSALLLSAGVLAGETLAAWLDPRLLREER